MAGASGSALKQFKEEMYDRAVALESPVACTFEITPRCNLRCHFCYVALDPYGGSYLDTQQMYAALDRIGDAGVLWLTLTGGEIMFRRDFLDIYRHARRRGMLVTLYTNATLVSDEIAEALRAEPPHAIEVSIYGADREHYERTTGIKGSFARFERGVWRLQKAGLRPTMKHVVSTLSEDHIDAVREWCKQRNLPLKVTTNIEHRLTGGDQPTVYRIQPRRAREIRADLAVAARAANGITAEPAAPGRTHEPAAATGTEEPRLPLAECVVPGDPGDGADRLYRCRAGRAGFFVDALGNVSHCIWDREPNFPLLEMPWPEIQRRMLEWVNQPLPAEAPCSGCSLRSGCNNCPARARLATGSPFLRDRYQCDATHEAFAAASAGTTAASSRPPRLAACVSS